MFIAEITACRLNLIDTEPRQLVSLSAANVPELMVKVDGVCAAFAVKNGFADHSLTVTITEEK